MLTWDLGVLLESKGRSSSSKVQLLHMIQDRLCKTPIIWVLQTMVLRSLQLLLLALMNLGALPITNLVLVVLAASVHTWPEAPVDIHPPVRLVPAPAPQVFHQPLAILRLHPCLVLPALGLARRHPHSALQALRLLLLRRHTLQRHLHKARPHPLVIRRPPRAIRQPHLLTEGRLRRQATHPHHLHSVLHLLRRPHRQCTAQLLQCTVRPVRCMVVLVAVASSPRRHPVIHRRLRRTAQQALHRRLVRHIPQRVQCTMHLLAALSLDLRLLLARNIHQTALSIRQLHQRRTEILLCNITRWSFRSSNNTSNSDRKTDPLS